MAWDFKKCVAEFKRTTPAKDSVEWTAIESRYQEAVKTLNPLEDIAYELKEKITATRGVKIKETLEKRLEKLQAKIRPLQEEVRKLRETMIRANYEDFIQGDSEAHQLAAISELKIGGYEANKFCYNRLVELAIAEVGDKLANPEDIRSAALDAVSSFSSYLGKRTLADQVDLAINLVKKTNLRRRASETVRELNLPQWQKNDFFKQLDNCWSEIEFAQVINNATAIHVDLTNKLRAQEENILAGIGEDGATNDELLKHINGSYNEKTKSNFYLSFDEASVLIKQMQKDGRLKVGTVNGVKKLFKEEMTCAS